MHGVSILRQDPGLNAHLEQLGLLFGHVRRTPVSVSVIFHCPLLLFFPY